LYRILQCLDIVEAEGYEGFVSRNLQIERMVGGGSGWQELIWKRGKPVVD